MSLLTDLLGNDDAEWMQHPRRNCAISDEFTPKDLGIVADQWFPSESGEAAIAKRLCDGCPVASQCFLYAYKRPEIEGVWGGTTTGQRAKLRTRMNKAAADAA